MKLYDYEISYHNQKTKERQYLLTEEKESSASISHVLRLNNNQYRKVAITSNLPFSNIVPNQKISFIVNKVLSFSTTVGSNEIFYHIAEEGNLELRDYWLSHTFLPILLTIENKYYILHAGAVEIFEKPVLFVADSFGGKSTMTDFFIKKGHTMISDDKVATYDKDGFIYSVPSYPYHRPYRKMEDLGIFVENFAKENKIINCIFNLVKSDAKASIKIEEIFGVEKFKVLRYATDIDLPVEQEKKFTTLANIANKVQIYSIIIPWDLNRLEEVYQTIINFINNRNKGIK